MRLGRTLVSVLALASGVWVVLPATHASAVPITPPACAGTTVGTTFTLTADCDTTVPLEVPDGFTVDGASHTITAHDPSATVSFIGAVVTNAGTSMHLRNLTIRGTGFPNITCDLLAGIQFADADGSVTDVTVLDITRNNSCVSGNGMRVNAVAPRTVTITNTTLAGFQRSGLLANGPATVHVAGSTIGPADDLAPGANAQNTVQIGGGDAGGTFTGNTIIGRGFGGPPAVASSTAMLVTTASNVTISNNTITGAGTDIGIAVSAGSTNITIENNVIERIAPIAPDSVGIGVQVDATSTGAATLVCNTFSGWIVNLTNVNQAPCITTTTPLPDGTVGSPYSATLAGHTPNPALTWSASGLPPGLTLASDGTISGTPTTPGPFTVTATATDSIGTTTTQDFIITIAAQPPPAAGGDADVVSVTPARLLDSRGPNSTVDGLGSGGGPMVAGSVTEVQVAGRGGVPSDAVGAVLNVTVVSPAADAFATVFPCGQSVPTASNLNYRLGVDIANAVIVQLDAGGKACIYTFAVTHLLADVNGYIPAGSAFSTLTPARLLDSRGPNSTVDGVGGGGGPMVAGSVTEVQVAGRGGVPVGAAVAVLNVTVVGPAADAFATVFPCGQSVPTASNINYRLGVDIANAVIVQLGVGGKACIYTFAVTHLLADVNGYVPAGAAFSTLTPARLLDSRGPNSTVDGLGSGGGPIGAGSVTEVQVAGRGGVPADAVGAVLNVTVVSPAADAFATVFPCGQSVPTASNINYRLGVDIANTVIVQLDAGGKACIYTFAVTHLLADVNGYIPA